MESISSKIENLKNSKEEELIEDEKIDRIIKNISLKKPKTLYSLFLSEQIKLIKKNNKDQKIIMSEMAHIFSEKWKNLKDEEKKKYEKLFDEEKNKYKTDIELVRHYLFKDFNFDSLNPSPTACRIYLNEKLIEGFEKGIDPKDVKKEAFSNWANMSNEEKQIYIDKKKENDNWLTKAKNLKKINPISLFVQKKIQESLLKGKDPPLVKDISPSWKNLSEEEKNNFRKYADALNEEKEKMKDIYELVHGLKPKKPCGAFQIFAQEKAKNNEIKDFTDVKEKWKELSEEEKEKYLMKSHRCLLAYKYKKMIYSKKIKKILPKKPLGALQIFLKEKKGQKAPNGEIWINYWKSIFENLSNEEKKKYEQKAEKSREIYDKTMSNFENKIFDIPKRPKSGFALYVKDRLPDLKKEKPIEIIQNLVKQVANEWKEKKIVDFNHYNKLSEKDKKRFIDQLKEFEKFGYYTNSIDKKISKNGKDEDIEENSEEVEKIEKKRKKKRTPIISSKKTKSKRTSSEK